MSNVRAIVDKLLYQTTCTHADARALDAHLKEQQRIADALEWHGCLTGDCPHQTAHACVESLSSAIRETVAELRA